MKPRAVILVGLPCAGKTTYALSDRFSGFEYISPETMGATIPGTVGYNRLRNKLQYLIYNSQSFVVDDTNHTRAMREFYVKLIKEYQGDLGYTLECHHLHTSLRECVKNAEARRKIGGHRLDKRQLIECKRKLEDPLSTEGFTSILEIPFNRTCIRSIVGKAVFFGFDGVIRHSKGNYSYPESPQEVALLPFVNSTLRRYYEKGYKLIGFCHQPAIASKDLSLYAGRQCMLETVRQLRSPVDSIVLCPHDSFENCGCFPLMVGVTMSQFRLDPARCVFVGASAAEMKMGGSLPFEKTLHRNSFFHLYDTQGEMIPLNPS